jgi:antitoxin CptB
VAEIDARPEDTLKHQRLGRISYRAWRRGFREADMVLGPFTDQVGPMLSDEELDQLETLLDEEDQYLYAWIIEKEPTPPEFDGPMLARIRTFMREHVAAEVAKGIG